MRDETRLSIIAQIDRALALAIDRLNLNDVDGEEREHIDAMQAARATLVRLAFQTVSVEG